MVLRGKRMSDVTCAVLRLTLLDSPSKTTSRCLEKVLLITAVSHSYNSPSIGPHTDPLRSSGLCIVRQQRPLFGERGRVQ